MTLSDQSSSSSLSSSSSSSSSLSYGDNVCPYLDFFFGFIIVGLECACRYDELTELSASPSAGNQKKER
ncbi:hypothetical protein DY000_02020837 [Brassica cretica]|uniref:Uncharacterized protein n=1 Tax=Brassica cretica TaxID=69181 RepID=A0ABQ7EE09_BRACR|nr:hypothetical protein DY000_02020837 [Brassica cretica]